MHTFRTHTHTFESKLSQTEHTQKNIHLQAHAQVQEIDCLMPRLCIYIIYLYIGSNQRKPLLVSFSLPLSLSFYLSIHLFLSLFHSLSLYIYISMCRNVMLSPLLKPSKNMSPRWEKSSGDILLYLIISFNN